MSSAFRKWLAVSVSIAFFGSMLLLFSVNRQAYNEINNLSFASYNLVGMQSQLLVVSSLYGLTGFLNIIICLQFIKENTGAIVGKSALLVASTCWTSFIIFPVNIDDPFTYELLLIRIIIFSLAAFLGLLFMSIDDSNISLDPFMKWYTLISALFICFIGLLNIFIFTDTTWVRTNLLIVTYFTWYLIYGLVGLRTRKRAKL